MDNSLGELVQKFLNGDPKAFEVLVERFRRKIYSLAYQVLGNHLDADEVVQETFVRVYRKREELKDVKYFSSFIIRVATNYSIDLLRKRKGHSGIPDDTGTLPGSIQLDLSQRVATPSDDFEKKRLMEEVTRALEQLPPRQKLTAILHDVEGYSKSEIAEVFDCPEATVRSNLHIARSKIKKILKQRFKAKE
ncbi:MAG: RNA polymerase sigma factor [Candidatus Zixiibacteriota bacterium]|nr:MAG: RNA polymerase sigma factor [candidate division Zixibacteria bacterium]